MINLFLLEILRLKYHIADILLQMTFGDHSVYIKLDTMEYIRDLNIECRFLLCQCVLHKFIVRTMLYINLIYNYDKLIRLYKNILRQNGRSING